MKAYRLLNEEELNLILSGDVEALGKHFERDFSNNHKYKADEKYIHFFLKREDCEYMKHYHRKAKVKGQNYVAEFKIPIKRVIGYLGKGKYEPLSGYDYNYANHYELAIPARLFDASWLTRYEPVSLSVNHEKPERQSG